MKELTERDVKFLEYFDLKEEFNIEQKYLEISKEVCDQKDGESLNDYSKRLEEYNTRLEVVEAVYDELRNKYSADNYEALYNKKYPREGKGEDTLDGDGVSFDSYHENVCDEMYEQKYEDTSEEVQDFFAKWDIREARAYRQFEGAC